MPPLGRMSRSPSEPSGPPTCSGAPSALAEASGPGGSRIQSGPVCTLAAEEASSPPPPGWLGCQSEAAVPLSSEVLADGVRDGTRKPAGPPPRRLQGLLQDCRRFRGDGVNKEILQRQVAEGGRGRRDTAIFELLAREACPGPPDLAAGPLTIDQADDTPDVAEPATEEGMRAIRAMGRGHARLLRLDGTAPAGQSPESLPRKMIAVSCPPYDRRSRRK